MKIKFKHIAITAAFGIIANTVGALLKILHWEFPVLGIKINGSTLLILGTILWILAAILLMIKAITAKNQDVLNK
ncbi:hypothetical protein BST92_11225 [Nonlabens arenilitoris]|uniref:Gliding motility protein GldL n=1 Tax=Nonlabens arenilitoris TaxID=1217969 RepID=A0A2S7UE19_9FLAO|nr:hypothetical protein [Nonlabens arenilitoris]PQJ32462.1 hypothetical protein BST92_11225 [Nonlabens arenilitoris]